MPRGRPEAPSPRRSIGTVGRLGALGLALAVAGLRPPVASAAPPGAASPPVVEPPTVDPTPDAPTEGPTEPTTGKATDPSLPDAPAPELDAPLADGAGNATKVDPTSLGADASDPIRRAFRPRVADRNDPFGPRPPGVPALNRAQIVTFALDNPAVDAASAKIEAMESRLLEARFAWVPIIKTNVWLSPGANVDCDDVFFAQTDEVGNPLTDGSGAPLTQTFQYCRPGGNEDLDIQTIQGYLQQLGRAGVFVRVEAEFVVPIYTFGKIRNSKKLAEIGVALAELERQAVRQKTILKVYQAHAALQLARESLQILDEAYKVLDEQREVIEKDLGGGVDSFDADPSEMNPDRDPDDLVRVELATIEMAELAREARKIEATSLAALWALAGDAAPPGFDVAKTQIGLEAVDGGLKPSTHYKQVALKNRPEALLAQGAVEARRQQEKLARSNFFPDLGFAVRTAFGYGSAFEQGPALYYNNRLNFSRIAFGLVLDWKLDFHNDAFRLKRARAKTRQAMSEREVARRLLQLEVEQAYQDLTDAKADAELLALARDKSWSLVLSEQASGTVGAGDFKDLQKALEQWARFEFRRVQAVQSHNVALAKLSRAVGSSLGARIPQAGSAYETPTLEKPRTRRQRRRRDGVRHSTPQGSNSISSGQNGDPTP